MGKMFLYLSVVSVVFGANPVLSATNTQLEQLLAQVSALQNQVNSLQPSAGGINNATAISTARPGDFNDNVKNIQKFLASDSSLYPEGIINGRFGPATTRAIKRFQQRHGLDQVGNVGPKTLSKIKELISNSSLAGQGSIVSNPALTGVIKTVPINPSLIISGPTTTTPPANPAPKISITAPNPISAPSNSLKLEIFGLNEINITTSTVRIDWHTNKSSFGKMYFSMDPLVSDNYLVLDTPAIGSSHFFALNTLSSRTKYYYYVEAKDAVGNIVKSPIRSFSTNP